MSVGHFNNQLCHLIRMGLKLDKSYRISVMFKTGWYRVIIIKDGKVREFTVTTQETSTNFIAEKIIKLIRDGGKGVGT